MAVKKTSNGPRAAFAGKYHEATVVPGGGGAVVKGAEISKQAAIDRRKNSGDIVVCGPDVRENRREAAEVETAASGVGNVIRHGAHGLAGPNALNHYQAITPPPTGHCFYETKSQKAK
jgi:hypothetical protein